MDARVVRTIETRGGECKSLRRTAGCGHHRLVSPLASPGIAQQGRDTGIDRLLSASKTLHRRCYTQGSLVVVGKIKNWPAHGGGDVSLMPEGRC
jgi:hypothetical protein